MTNTLAPAEMDLSAEHLRGLSIRQRLFVNEYFKDFNATQATKRAGFPNTRAIASIPRVREAIAVEMARRIDMEGAGAPNTGDVLREMVRIATADPNDIVHYRRAPCRYCHGEGHRYQYSTQRALDVALKAFSTTIEALVQDFEHGGMGFDPRLEPNDDCPECHGEGIGEVFVHDTRMLNPAARALYAGIEMSKDGGIKIKMHDKVKNLELLARHLGLLKDTLDVNVKSDLAERLLAGRLRAGMARTSIANEAE